MTNLFRLLITISLVLLSACATAPGQAFSQIEQPKSDKGNVYLYRTGALFAMGEGFDVQVDNKDSGKFFNKSYLLFSLSPGQHVLKVSPKGIAAKVSELNVEVAAGATSFYQYDFVTGPLANFFFVGSSIAPRDKDVALTALKELKSATADVAK